MTDQEALKTRLFVSTLIGMAFNWYSTLPEDSIQNWAMQETRRRPPCYYCLIVQSKVEGEYVNIRLYLQVESNGIQMLICIATSIAGRHLP